VSANPVTPIRRRPTIDVTECELSELTKEVITALDAANDPPQLFRQKGLPVRVDLDENGKPVVRPVKLPHIRHALGDVCVFAKHLKKSTISVAPPRDLCENVLVTPDLPFPGLRGIVGAPFFNAAGRFITAGGYDRGSRLYLAIESGFAVPSVPAKPTSVQLADAVAIVDDLFREFPFKGPADKAHTFAMMLLPFVREMIDGPTPLHLVGAPIAGTGKTLLAQTALYPSAGLVAASSFTNEDDEQRKAITTFIVGGCPAVLLDKLEGRVKSRHLCAVLTSDSWKDRLLGTNSEIDLPNRAVWVATSNNATLSRDITRRTISIRLDANVENPAGRAIKREDPLLDYARKNRAAIVAACLTIAQSWISNGKPKPKGIKPLGSFESWSRTIGGILSNAQIDGFLGNAQELSDASDDRTELIRAFVEQWFEQRGEEQVTTAMLLPLAVTVTLIESEGKSPSAALGRLLASQADAVYGDLKITRCKLSAGVQYWRLRALDH
jgi:putative DNA primase/helicase